MLERSEEGGEERSDEKSEPEDENPREFHLKEGKLTTVFHSQMEEKEKEKEKGRDLAEKRDVTSREGLSRGKGFLLLRTVAVCNRGGPQRSINQSNGQKR